MTAAALAVGSVAVAMPVALGAPGAAGPVVIPAAADTYVIRQFPGAVKGGADKLTAARWTNWQTEAYLSFVVPPSVTEVDGATLELELQPRANQPATVELRELASGWSETTTSWANRPVPGRVVRTVTVGASARMLSIDVGPLVDGPGTYSFALTNPDDASAATVRSREAGAAGPRLVLDEVPAGAPVVPPPTTAPPTTRPTTAPTTSPSATTPASTASAVTPRPSNPPTTPSTAPLPAGPTLCGASFQVEGGETYQQALVRTDERFGGLDMVRVFYPGAPGAWPGRLDAGTRPLVVSFKYDPREVVAGRHDAALRDWFATAPRDQEIYWTYYHEPEDNIAAGEFSAQDYRSAWTRIRSLADRASNPRLHATLILMSWSLDPRSGRDWEDYYPGRDVIQVLGWDNYNLAAAEGGYQDPVAMFERTLAISEAEGLPFGVAETGSHLAAGDDGERRAAWLRALTRHLTASGALWVAYFDLDWPTGDYRLRDAPSVQAWRDFC
ncbi:MAG: DNRLRE domain-containing protein [Pseudonocardiales bacterium]|nr:DNRLRE domain-containing protein [Pseudonocardiales bacterium]